MTIASCSSAWPPCTPLHRVHSLSPPLTSHQHGLPTTLKRSTCVRAAAATVIASASRLDHSVHSEGLPVVFTAKPASVPPEPLVLNRPHGVSSSTSSSHGRLQSDGGYAVAAMRSGSLGAQTGATDASRGAGLLERASSLVLDLNREGKHSVSEASSNQILQGTDGVCLAWLML